MDKTFQIGDTVRRVAARSGNGHEGMVIGDEDTVRSINGDHFYLSNFEGSHSMKYFILVKPVGQMTHSSEIPNKMVGGIATR